MDWMRHVRVGDADRRWLWPNSPYVLRLQGIVRVERYGGLDPGKRVDDEFAANFLKLFVRFDAWAGFY